MPYSRETIECVDITTRPETSEQQGHLYNKEKGIHRAGDSGSKALFSTSLTIHLCATFPLPVSAAPLGRGFIVRSTF